MLRGQKSERNKFHAEKNKHPIKFHEERKLNYKKYIEHINQDTANFHEQNNQYARGWTKIIFTRIKMNVQVSRRESYQHGSKMPLR